MFSRFRWLRREPPEKLTVYMDAIEFSQLLAIVEALGPRRCLEWGCGGSTATLLERCPFIERYYSIEHDAAWYERVRAEVQDPRLSLQLVLPDKPLPEGRGGRDEVVEWCALADRDPTVMASYVQFPRRLETSFDLVLVDGRARPFCIELGFELLEPGGVLVLHDAQRVECHAALSRLPRVVFLEPWKQGQLCLARKP